MQTLSVNEFRAHLKEVADSAISQHEPIRITRRNNGNFVLISEEDWNAEQETLYVLQNRSLMKQIFNSSKTVLPSKKLTQEELHAEFDV
ncbi:MAG: type II toxin-antitoxin system Phd/YefM family antitoxin [Myxococcaceae bacterium]